MPQTQLDPDAVNLAKAVRQTESGGNFQAKGKSGEYGAYQFTAPTWDAWSKKHGVNIPLDKATPEQQNEVAYKQIKEWKDSGLNVGQIASMWNSGKPDAYLDTNYKGQNKYGVSYDVPAYAKSVATAYHTIKGGGAVGADPQNPSSTASLGQPQGQDDSLGAHLKGRLDDASKAIQQGTTGQINPLSSVLQTAGAAAGGVGDVIGAGLGLIPGVKQVEGLVGQGVGALASTAPGQAVVGAAQDFAQKHPELAGDIGAAGNIASLVGGGIGGNIAKDVGIQGVKDAAVKGVLGSGVKEAVEKATYNKAAKILETAPTMSGIKGAIRTGKVGIEKGAATLAPDPLKEASIKELVPLVKEGIVKPGSAASNAVSIKAVADQTARDMRDALKNQEVQNILQPEELQAMAQKVSSRAGESLPTGENPAKSLLDVFYKALPQGKDITAEDVLNARQAVSRFVLDNKGDWSTRGVMTGFKSARDAIWDESRNLLVNLAPNVPVKEMLTKQANLYRALDYLPASIKRELTAQQKTAIGRYFAKHPVQAFVGKRLATGALIGTGLGPVAQHLGL